MEKRTYYLSVGHFHFDCNLGSKTRAAVLAKKGVCLLSPHEEALWSVLSYKPLAYAEMTAVYKNLLHTSNMDEGINIEECLRHLCELELVISGEGEYEIEARYEIMRNVLILLSPKKQAQSAPFLLARNPGSLLPRLKRRVFRQEVEVLALLREAPLTTAQLVMAVECKTWSAETLESVTEHLDRYGDKAMKAYAEMMYSSPHLERVLDAVFSLRRDEQIIYIA